MNNERKRTMRAQIGIGDLSTIGVIFVVLAVVLAIGAYILTTINTTANFAANSASANAVTYGTSSLSTFAQWLPILAIVIVAGIIIYILMNVFHGGGGRAV
jgi:hypothetical protein